MKAGWRWFGPADAISLAEIRQAGVTDVVTSLYEQPVGAVWPMARIRETAKACRDNGMAWTVVESVPVHEDVKKRTGDFRRYVCICAGFVAVVVALVGASAQAVRVRAILAVAQPLGV